jgi:hypothetical protein
MKKFLMILAAAFVVVSASAQVYVGGSFGVASTKVNGGDSHTTYKFLPEIGYNVDNNLAIGTVVGWGKGNPVNIERKEKGTFEVSPYVRYTFVHSNVINAFVEGGVGYKHYNDAGDMWNLGLKPGVSLNFKNFSFVTRVGFVGWRQFNPKEDHVDSSNAWGVSLDGNDVTFGLYYNF